jgi:hypothetical protein
MKGMIKSFLLIILIFNIIITVGFSHTKHQGYTHKSLRNKRVEKKENTKDFTQKGTSRNLKVNVKHQGYTHRRLRRKYHD